MNFRHPKGHNAFESHHTTIARVVLPYAPRKSGRSSDGPSAWRDNLPESSDYLPHSAWYWAICVSNFSLNFFLNARPRTHKMVISTAMFITTN